MMPEGRLTMLLGGQRNNECLWVTEGLRHLCVPILTHQRVSEFSTIATAIPTPASYAVEDYTLQQFRSPKGLSVDIFVYDDLSLLAAEILIRSVLESQISRTG